jgi:hypothetical protein
MIVEIELRVTVQLDIDQDVADVTSSLDMERSAKIAVQKALDWAVDTGFTHPLADKASISIAAVDVI